MLQAILAAGTRYITVFGKSWDLHVTRTARDGVVPRQHR
jgi:isopropylmalate/homocitrate/citramalate synthase